MEAIVFGADGVATSGASEKLLIDMSTSGAGHTRDMAARLRDACGMGWLDAPISGGAPAALEGRMAVMVGGAEEFDALTQALDIDFALLIDASGDLRLTQSMDERLHWLRD